MCCSGLTALVVDHSCVFCLSFTEIVIRLNLVLVGYGLQLGLLHFLGILLLLHGE